MLCKSAMAKKCFSYNVEEIFPHERHVTDERHGDQNVSSLA